MKKQSLDIVWNSLCWSFYYSYYDYDDCGFVCFSWESPFWTGEVFPTKALIIQRRYISAVAFNPMNCHFFWWKITYLETRIPIISTDREWWHRKLCHKVTQELHIRAKDKMEQVWWKVTKRFLEGVLQRIYLLQPLQWSDSSFIFYQEKQKNHKVLKPCQQ